MGRAAGDLFLLDGRGVVSYGVSFADSRLATDDMGALLTLAHTRARARGARESGPRFGPRRRRFIFGEFVLLGSPAAVAAAL